jgi:hypothetical protein
LISLGAAFSFHSALADDEFSETPSSSVSIPNNGRYDSDDDYPKSPAVYAATLRQSITCLQPACEQEVLTELQMYFMNDLEDGFRAYYLGAVNTEGSFDDFLSKIQGFKVLEHFLRLNGFNSAAQFVEDKLTKAVPKLCLGFKPDTENPGQFTGECDYQKDESCEKKCLNESFQNLTAKLSDSERRIAATDAIFDSQLKAYKSTIGVCGVKNPSAQSQKVPPETSIPKALPDKNSKLCGIIDSPAIIGALSKNGSHFVGGEQRDPAEYRCSYVSLHIDKSQKIWRRHLDELNHNYVIGPDGHTYSLTESDVQTLQKEVEAFTLPPNNSNKINSGIEDFGRGTHVHSSSQ